MWNVAVAEIDLFCCALREQREMMGLDKDARSRRALLWLKTKDWRYECEGMRVTFCKTVAGSGFGLRM